MGLVALASIAGVAVLATNIQQTMTQSVAQNPSPVNSNPTVVSQNLAAPNQLVAAGQSGSYQSASTALPQENLCISNICANFPIVNGQNDLVDVAAGEGADMLHQFANTFEELAASIEADPNHDPQLAALIRGLAVNGHDLGDK
jgi:hypothetical protein